jgi:hypothetical protein
MSIFYDLPADLPLLPNRRLPLPKNALPYRWAGKQIVTEIDRPEVSDYGGVSGEPALRGVAFTVLLLCAVSRRDELRRQGRTDLRPGATRVAPRKAWKYSVPPSQRRHVEHCRHLILHEQKCSVPSSTISTRPPRRWNGASGPAA